MPSLTHERATFAAEVDERYEAMQERMRVLVEKAERLPFQEVDLVYAELESAAGRLVAKSNGVLSRDAAASEVLTTAEGKRLYDKYLVETARTARALELSEQARTARDRRAWVEERLVEKVVKATAAGEDPGAAVERLLTPEVAVALGVAPPGRVEKGSSAWDAIERRADALVSKSRDGLSRDAAVDRVLQDDPALYARYLREAGLDG